MSKELFGVLKIPKIYSEFLKHPRTILNFSGMNLLNFFELPQNSSNIFGLSWISSDFGRIPRNVLNFFGFHLTSWDLFELSYNSSGFLEIPRNPSEVFDHLRKSSDFFRPLWNYSVFLGIFGLPWISFGFNRVFLDSLRNASDFLRNIRELSYNSLDFHEFLRITLWTSLDFLDLDLFLGFLRIMWLYQENPAWW